MRRLITSTLSVSTLSVLLLGVSHAQAQTAAHAAPTPQIGAVGSAQPFVIPPPGVIPGIGAGVGDPVGVAFRQWLTRAAGYKHTPETDRADRVSVLIDAGKCSQARALADKEGDVLMAAKVPQVCEMKRRGLL